MTDVKKIHKYTYILKLLILIRISFVYLFLFTANVTNDGKHPLLEFAMKYFREGKFEPVLSDSTNDPNESGKEKKKAKKKKSGASDADWTWKDRIDMVKWTDRMINR